eukprot:3933486-Rhodomonas_salina.1
MTATRALIFSQTQDALSPHRWQLKEGKGDLAPKLLHMTQQSPALHTNLLPSDFSSSLSPSAAGSEIAEATGDTPAGGTGSVSAIAGSTEPLSAEGRVALDPALRYSMNTLLTLRVNSRSTPASSLRALHNPELLRGGGLVGNKKKDSHLT